MYIFKDELLNQIPEDHVVGRVYATSETETIVETSHYHATKVFTLPKMDISSLFKKVPTISVGTDWTYNDLYAKISDIYSLGLVQGIDYSNNDAVKPSPQLRYVDLPISYTSYGYYGNIGCNVVIGGLVGICNESQRDLRGSMTVYLKAVKLQSFLMSKRFGCDCGSNFIGDHFSGSFIETIRVQAEQAINEDSSKILVDILSSSVIDTFFNDGLSDVCSLRSNTGDVYLVRIKTTSDDTPLLSNETNNLETSDSKGLLVGMRMRVSENPEEGKGEINIQQSDSDISLLSVTPEENTDQVTEEVKDEITPVPVKKTRKKKS